MLRLAPAWRRWRERNLVALTCVLDHWRSCEPKLQKSHCPELHQCLDGTLDNQDRSFLPCKVAGPPYVGPKLEWAQTQNLSNSSEAGHGRPGIWSLVWRQSRDLNPYLQSYDGPRYPRAGACIQRSVCAHWCHDILQGWLSSEAGPGPESPGWACPPRAMQVPPCWSCPRSSKKEEPSQLCKGQPLACLLQLQWSGVARLVLQNHLGSVHCPVRIDQDQARLDRSWYWSAQLSCACGVAPVHHVGSWPFVQCMLIVLPGLWGETLCQAC